MNFIGFYNYTVWATYLSLISSIYGIFLAITGHTTWAIYCLMFSGFCDGFDGRIARTKDSTKQEKSFGVQIDSLADLICFGVLPTIIGYSIGLHSKINIVIFGFFTLAALIRLAYFNVLADENMNVDKSGRKAYTGLPVTSVAILVPFMYIIGNFFPHQFKALYAAFIGAVAIAFLLDFKLTKPNNKVMAAIIMFGILEMILIGVFKVHYGGI